MFVRQIILVRHLLAIKILSCFINLPCLLSTLRTNLPDLRSRVLVDDSFINIYYFFWTNSWYLPLFFLTLVLFTFLVDLHIPPRYILLPCLFTTLLLIEQVDYLWVNQPIHQLCGYATEFNILLTNNINKYHPAILYYGVVVALLTTAQLYVYEQLTGKIFTKAIKPRLLQGTARATVTTLTITLFMGGWWAAQEGSWGGWWNWDPSEVFGLLLMSFFLTQIHWNFRSALALPLLLRAGVGLTSLLTVYVFIQLNFDLVSHNFGTRSNAFVNPTHTYVVLLGVFVCQLTSSASKLIRWFSAGYTTVLGTPQLSRTRQALHSTLLRLLAYCVLYTSFAVLVNDFMWKMLYINVGNTVYTQMWPLVATLLYLLLRLWAPQSTTVLTLICAIVSTPTPLILLINLVVVVDKLYILHYLLFVFLFINVMSYLKTLNIWQVVDTRPVLVGEGLPTVLGTVSVANTSPLMEYCTPVLLQGFVVDSAWGFLFEDTSRESKVFAHTVLTQTTEQVLFVGNFMFEFLITSVEGPMNTLVVLMALVLTLWYLRDQKSLVIRF